METPRITLEVPERFIVTVCEPVAGENRYHIAIEFVFTPVNVVARVIETPLYVAVVWSGVAVSLKPQTMSRVALAPST